MNNNQASATAYMVMQGILYVADHSAYGNVVPNGLKESCRQLMTASDSGKKYLRQLQHPWRRKLLKLKERLLLPGIAMHYVMRKRFIEDYVHEQIQQGVTQVVNLGAGFDTLLLRLAKRHPEIQFIEVDHPATQKMKRQALDSVGGQRNLTLLPIRFDQERLDDRLLINSAFNENKKTLYILEGVLMYLSPESVKRTFMSLSNASGPNMQVLFTAAEPFHCNPENHGVLFRLYLKLMGEPLAWMCEKSVLNNFANGVGLQIETIAGATEFKSRYLPATFKDPLQTTEYIAIARPEN